MTLLRAAVLAGVAAAVAPAQALNRPLLNPLAVETQKPHLREMLADLVVRYGAQSAPAEGIAYLRRDVLVHGVGATSGQSPAQQALACGLAFEDAMTQLTVAARGAKAGAILGIVSTFDGEDFDDGRQYECREGTFHSHVYLKAQLARTAPPRPGRGGVSPRLAPVATDFAKIDDAAAVPIRASGQASYAKFLARPSPRAFVIYEDGGSSWQANDPDAMTLLLDRCAREGRLCWLYAVDDHVVWTPEVERRTSKSAQLEPRAAPAAAASASQP